MLVLIGISIAAEAYLQALNFPFISDDDAVSTEASRRILPGYICAALPSLHATASIWYAYACGRSLPISRFETLVDADMSAYPGHYVPASLKILHIQGPNGATREAIGTANEITHSAVRNIMIKLIQVDYAVNIRGVSASNLHETIKGLLNLGVDLDRLPTQAQWNYPVEAPFTEAKYTLEREWMILAEQFPEDLTLRYYAGLWLLGNGRFENAAVNLRAAIELQQLPESERGTALKHLGRALLSAGRVAEAEIPLRAALEQTQPRDGGVLLSFGSVSADWTVCRINTRGSQVS
jgi:hypothetical protein